MTERVYPRRDESPGAPDEDSGPVVDEKYVCTGTNWRDGVVLDASGQLRLVGRTLDWENLVELAVTEIRHFGGQSIQVASRLSAMLENLIQTLPESRASLLCRELTLLHRSAERFFTETEDRVLAEVSRLQGMAGSQRHAKADNRVIEKTHP